MAIIVAETHWTLDWYVLPVCVDAGVFLFARLAAAAHQVRAVGPPDAGLFSWGGKQQLLGKNQPPFLQ